MTVSMETTRLSSVITGCGGKLTTCSRRSIMYRTLSTNGTTMLRPAGSVSLYFPNRSTMPARACGMIRTVLASSTMTKAKNRTAIPSRYGVTGCSQSGSGWLGVGGRSRLERGVDRVHVDGRTLHGEHLDGRAGLDGQRAVVRDG